VHTRTHVRKFSFFLLQFLDDNLSVPLVTAVVATLLLPHADKITMVLGNAL